MILEGQLIVLAGFLCHIENSATPQLAENETSQMDSLICSIACILWNKSLLGFPTNPANFPNT